MTTDGRHATTLRLEQTQVTHCKAGIQVGCLPFTWALSLPGHTSQFRLFKNRTGSPEQKESCSTGVQNGEKGCILCVCGGGVGLRLSKGAPAPGTERHHKQVMNGGRVACCLPRFHVISRFQDEQEQGTDLAPRVARPTSLTHYKRDLSFLW